ncbi:YqgE/AlgH family protein [Tenacibaculum sp. C7A-26P2]|uniref:YqgE/AlgH family protein n=1 Tax=Tenacibaculum sp. C7A-26P2 TaxID=3447504 RepID=UPI003F8600F3
MPVSILKPEKGRLLIAEPSILNDRSFKRAIVLLTEHTQNSSVGFIMNRPLHYTLKDLVPDIDCDFTVYQGGPVESDNLYFIHKVPELLPNSVEVNNGIYWGGNFESLKKHLNNNAVKPSDVRFFLGYSGWDTNQLNDELKTNSWFVSHNIYSNIFTINNETIWKNQLLKKGGEYKIWANAPSDIQMN